jgi:glutaminyl-peptide cyclotransferase
MTPFQPRGPRPFIRLALFLALAGCGAKPQASSGPSAVASVPPAAPAAVPPSDALPAEKTGGFDGARAYAHVAHLVEIGPRPPGSDGIKRAQQYIQAELESYGCKVESDEFGADTPIGRVTMKNLLAKAPGGGSNVILLATHYDTLRMPGFVGADDAGSSTAVMLELARLLCKRKNALTVGIAFFDGEEALEKWSETDSRYGSRQMAARLASSGELQHIKAMLLADIVGNRNLRIKRESSSTPWLTDLVWSVARRLGYSKVFVSEETSVEDDHDSFLRRGVAAADVIDLEIPHWHTTQDTLDKVSAKSLGIVGHVFLESVAELEKKFR